jgi:hypothetical protein
MSCACNKIIEPNQNGLQYSLIGDTQFVKGYDLMTPLLPPMKAPRGGWKFLLYLRGYEIRIAKNRPYEVAAEVARLLALNEILYTPEQLWLNLNIQWVGRAVEKYQKVKLQDLLAISTQNF